MKLRLRENTVRFRLTRSEVVALVNGEVVEQTTRFAIGQSLSCAIIPSTDPRARMAYAGGEILLRLPTSLIAGWAETAEVSLRLEQRVDDDATLQILVEKDFVCLHGDDDNADAFPNPAAAESLCVAR